MTTAVERERARCLAIVETHLDYAKSLDVGRESLAPGAAALLIRISNQIRGGGPPVEFGKWPAWRRHATCPKSALLEIRGPGISRTPGSKPIAPCTKRKRSVSR